ncbi:hypothetical protein FCM35_KLT19365 [Carex littledalei]|uniref:Uncharacterized protein n=1 Tax=Carex littledalei TaxID=544730 RepID=A0A833VXP3_9POAL|nr:hypothetical protein FCM35_KLT19365 [Carex littledalei]
MTGASLLMITREESGKKEIWYLISMKGFDEKRDKKGVRLTGKLAGRKYKQGSTDPKGKGKMEFSENQKRSTDAKANGKLELSEKRTCARNNTLKMSNTNCYLKPQSRNCTWVNGRMMNLPFCKWGTNWYDVEGDWTCWAFSKFYTACRFDDMGSIKTIAYSFPVSIYV